MVLCKGAFYQLFLIFIFLILHHLVFCQKKSHLLPEAYIKLINLKCDFEPNWAVNVTCKMKPVNWERTITNISIDLLQPLRNFSAHAQAFRLETQYIPFLVNVRKNICDVLQEKGIDFYSRIALRFVNEFLTNKNVKCPLVGHLEFRNAYLKGSSLFLIFPPGTYKLICTIYEAYPPVRVGSVTYFANVVEKRPKF